MKNNLLIIIVLLIVSAITLSCQNDENQPEILEDSLSISEAMDWVDKNFLNNASYSGIFKSNTVDGAVFDLKPLFNWNLAEIDNDSIWSIVELPWEYEDGFVKIANYEVKQQAESNQTDIIQVEKLVILKNRITGDIYGFKMIVIPDLNYMLSNIEDINSNCYLKRDPNLSGVVLYYSVKGEFINGWKYNDGKITAKVDTQNSDSQANIIGYYKAISNWEYYSIETCYYSYASAGGYTSEPKLMYCRTEYFTTLIADGTQLFGGSGGVELSQGDGGGGNSTTNTKPSDPCAEIKKVKADAALNERLKDYIEKAKKEQYEDGYLVKSDGSFIYPKTRESGKVQFEFNSTDKYSEFTHMHQDLSGGTFVFSGKDLNTLYSMYINNRMINPSTFRYIVVSSFGIGSLHITDPVAFKNFGNKYSNDLESLNNIYKETPKAGNDINDALKQFLDILKETNAGLTFSLGEFDMESKNPVIEWNTKQLDALGNVVNLNCN